MPVTRHLLHAALVVLLATLLAVGTTVPSLAELPPGLVALRLSAADAVETSVVLSELTFPDGADRVLIGREDAFPDNLASGVLQGDSPLLLTDSAQLDPRIAAEIARLGATEAVVLGGEAAISDAVADELALTTSVSRLAGPTRIETSVAVAETVTSATAILARSTATDADATAEFADALGAGGWAAASGYPVLLTQSDVLTPTTADHLSSAGYTDILIVGGTAAVSQDVQDAVDALGIATERIEGPTRFATASAIAEERGLPPGNADRVILTEGQSGDAWVSGFTAAGHAGTFVAPVVLSNGGALPADTAAHLNSGGFPADGIGLVCTPSVDAQLCQDTADDLGATVVDVDIDNPWDLSPDPDPDPDVDTTVDAPQLTDVSVLGSTPTQIEVGFRFDETIAAVGLDPSLFVLSTPLGRQNERFDAVAVVRDPGNTAVARATFGMNETIQARVVTASIDSGAAQDLDGLDNVEGQAPVADVVLPAGRTDGPDLVSVTFDQGADATAGGDESVTYTFDEPLDDSAGFSAANFAIIGGDGTVYGGLNPVVSGVVDDESVTVRHNISTADWLSAARVFVNGPAVTDGNGKAPIQHTLPIHGGSTVLPDPVEVQLLPDTDEVVWTFDEPVTVNLQDRFFLYDVQGRLYGSATILGASGGGTEQITVQYTLGTVNEGIVAGSLSSSAVTSVGSGLNNTFGFVGIERTYPAGYVWQPALASAQRTVIEQFGNPVGLDLTLTFGVEIDRNAGAVHIYTADGTRTAFDAAQCTDAANTHVHRDDWRPWV
ncbi:hypothetical protein BH23ACT9_BH23ACT9_35580 [soil metagenome]